jgi:hypothetical protein
LTNIRTIIFSIIAFSGGLIIAVAGLEIGLRFCPVETSPFLRSMTKENSVLRAEPEAEFRFSSGWNFVNSHSGQYNNDGFINEQDYTVDGSHPLIAVIGDSYIEAKMVEHTETLQGRLEQRFQGDGRVYSFAMSGAPLSQYLSWASYARATYGADALIISIVANDFDESLAEYKLRDGFFHYARNADDTLELRLSEYRPSLLRQIALRSALARYLVFHLRIGDAWARLRGMVTSSYMVTTERAETVPGGNDLGFEFSLAMLNAFFRDLSIMSGLPPEKILFVVDGRREALYAENEATASFDSYFGRVRRAFISMARQRNYSVVDLHNAFETHYQKHGKRFDSDLDYHWSSYGHKVVYEAVVNSGWLDNFVKTE